jgi:exonuclease 3'-5' domain-containing protein 1
MTCETQPKIIDNIQDAQEICQQLTQSSAIAIDLEGERLGRDGNVSLILVTTGDGPVYCFDVQTLGAAVVELLRPILCDPGIHKLCYDCRGDADALYHLFGVQMQGVYDLQVAFTFLYQAHGDPFLKGLQRALAAPGVIRNQITLKQTLEHKQTHKIEMRRGRSGSLFGCRPLSAETLQYCAQDVAPLVTMYHLWSKLFDVQLVLQTSAKRMHDFCFGERPVDSKNMARVDFQVPLFQRPPWHAVSQLRNKRKLAMICAHVPQPKSYSKLENKV